MPDKNQLLTLGWREWVALPDLGLPAIKVKVDSGARTSALHAFYTEKYQLDSVDMVKFLIHPIQKNYDFHVECHAPIIDFREVSDSGGHKEMRYVIETSIVIGTVSWPIELNLTNRDTMRFRMLLGRRAIEARAVIDPVASYLNGKLRARKLYQL
ncbi:MAG: RimK/LysX family protein [Gammaproteobacteria bacterium]|nr:RimK/LysX family protein [Gammaproteobacteria bacterium]MCZ6881439.1 RimK/LysX family protein [Gammaproteobacteria bacterium]